MSNPDAALSCDHCGGDAYTTDDIRDGEPWFTDGAGEKCAECGMPGYVLVADHDEIYWHSCEECGETCERGDCEDCRKAQPSARKDLAAGLLSAKTKPLVDLGDFTQYLDKEAK